MNLKRSPFSILNKERKRLTILKEFTREKFKLKLNLIKIPKMKIRKIQSKLKIY